MKTLGETLSIMALRIQMGDIRKMLGLKYTSEEVFLVSKTNPELGNSVRIYKDFKEATDRYNELKAAKVELDIITLSIALTTPS